MRERVSCVHSLPSDIGMSVTCHPISYLPVGRLVMKGIRAFIVLLFLIEYVIVKKNTLTVIGVIGIGVIDSVGLPCKM